MGEASSDKSDMSLSAWTILIAIQEVVVLIVIVTILLRPREPRGMLAWILALLLLPGLGLVLYFLFGEPRRGWHRRRRRRKRRRLRKSSGARGKAILQRQRSMSHTHRSKGIRRLAGFASRLGAFPCTDDNDVIVYHDAEKTFLAIQLAIEAAQSHIHLEYYVYQPDDTGRAIRDLLIEKARQGVACRLLLDFVGSWRIGRSFLAPMKEAGIQIAFALPVILLRGRWHANYRNHRKIAVIDGKIGFTGSQNIGDEYRGRLARFAPWRDTHLKIVGPAVQHLQEVFVEDWHYTTQEDLLLDEFFPEPTERGDHCVQIVPSGPDNEIHVMHQLLFAAVGAARSSISVITPYFAPDTSMLLAFQSASYRGVKVRLVIPARSDLRSVLWAGRSFYEDLIRAGVEVYEHADILLHSKVMVVDQTWAMVGSANMDVRSFRINFEATTMLYSEQLAEELYADFEQLRQASRRITMEDVADPPLPRALLLGVARLASPVL